MFGFSLLAMSLTNANDVQNVDLGDVVVTATGFETDVKDIPASVDIVTQEELEERPIRDLGAAIENVPGVEVQTDKTGQSTISIRGFDNNYTLVLIDGKSQNTDSGFRKNGFGVLHSFIPPISMIERIEVLKGPASTIYGGGAIGGVVNVITKKHPSKASASLTLETIQQEERKIWGSSVGISGLVATPIVDDILSLNVRGKYYDQLSNNIKIPGTDKYGTHAPGGYGIKGVGSRLTFTPNKLNDLYLDVEFYEQLVDVLSTSSAGIRVTRTYTKTNAVLNHDGNYSFGKMNTYMQYGTAQLHTGSSLQSDNYVIDSKINTPFDFGDAGYLSLISGVNYTFSQFKDDASNSTNVPSIVGHHLNHNQVALYAEADYAINEIVSVVGGGRYNYSDLFKHNFSPRIYAIAHPTDIFTIKAGVAAGYFTPSIKQLYPGVYAYDNSNPQLGNPDLKPEKSWNYEISGILDLPWFNATLTGFFTQFIDKVSMLENIASSAVAFGGVSCPSGTCQQPYNIDNAIQYGAEIGLQTKEFYGFKLDSGYTLGFSKILSGKSKGEPLAYVPRQSFTAKVSYKINEFNAFLSYRAKIKTSTSLAQSRRKNVGPYYRDVHLLDLGLGYKMTSNLHLNFTINNLTNKSFLDFADSINKFPYYQPGRNYWLSLRLDV